MTLTSAQFVALKHASSTSDGFLFPYLAARFGVAPSMTLCRSLQKKGFATTASCPQITDAGRAAVEAEHQRRLQQEIERSVHGRLLDRLPVNQTESHNG